MAFELDNVTFSYTNSRKVIDRFSIRMGPGKFYGIVGPNGCGKTTILDILTRHLEPAEGRVLYKGQSLSSYSKKELAKEIALVPQNFYINFPFTVREVVMMGRYPHIPRFAQPTEEDMQIVETILKNTETDAFADRYITELSGGERQRVVFARALVQKTPVLILDEATSNLDINYSVGLLNTVAQRVRNSGDTVIAVMQNINLAAIYCDYMIFMKHGTIVSHGPTGEVLNPETIRSVFNIDSKVYFEDYSNSLQVVFRK